MDAAAETERNPRVSIKFSLSMEKQADAGWDGRTRPKISGANGEKEKFIFLSS